MPKIAVFAGHGGSDFGVVDNGLIEKNMTLETTKELTSILKQRGYQVINNRTTDVNRSISRDAALANSNNVDAVLEVHYNSNFGIPASGTETFYSVKSETTGKQLATAINNNIAALGLRNRGAKTRKNIYGNDYYAILRLTNAPAVLIEPLFVNNPEDAKKYDPKKIAMAIANGVSQVIPIKKGDDNIRQIQATLNNRYNTNLVVDGIFGKNTQKALIKGLQTELNKQYNANLVVDGIWGNKTQSQARSVRKGAKGNITYLIQAALYIKGYPIKVDGIFGNATEYAIKDFQRANGLNVTGVADPLTQKYLFSK